MSSGLWRVGWLVAGPAPRAVVALVVGLGGCLLGVGVPVRVVGMPWEFLGVIPAHRARGLFCSVRSASFCSPGYPPGMAGTPLCGSAEVARLCVVWQWTCDDASQLVFGL